jgi:hypothetical protein
MGDLDGLVSKLLDVYTRSIKLLSAHRKINRKHERVSDERDSQEASLLKSLRRSKSDVLQAYRQDLVRAGPRFSHGDGESFPKDMLGSIKIRVLTTWQQKQGRPCRISYHV